jgi:hypothetical protein
MSAPRPSALRDLLAFFAITFAVTWGCWYGVAAVSGGTLRLSGAGMPLFYLGVFAPSLVALGLSARRAGPAGARALLGRVFQGPGRARWAVFAVGYMAAIKLTVALIHRLATGVWPSFGAEAWYLVIAAIPISTPVQAGEEIGWRGFALPRMAGRMGLGPASLVLGVIWAAWHLPLFFIPGADTTGQSFPLYLLQATAVSVAMGWLYGHTRGSLLTVMLLHAAVNNTKDIVPSYVPGATNALAPSTSLTAWLTVALLWLCAAVFLARMPRVNAGPAGATSASTVE